MTARPCQVGPAGELVGAESLSDSVERREPDVGDEQADHAAIGWRDREEVAEHRRRGVVEVERAEMSGSVAR